MQFQTVLESKTHTEISLLKQGKENTTDALNMHELGRGRGHEDNILTEHVFRNISGEWQREAIRWLRGEREKIRQERNYSWLPWKQSESV